MTTKTKPVEANFSGEKKKAETSLGIMWPCMVCGKPAPACAPLTICDSCKNTKDAEILRAKHKAFFFKQRSEHLADEADALEIYLAAALGQKPITVATIESTVGSDDVFDIRDYDEFEDD